MAQGLLFLLALGSLYYKRQTESPRRSLRVWSFDVSKQGLSSLCAHVSGLLWSHALAGSDASECAYYFVVFTVDTTVGVAVALALHRRVVEVARLAETEAAPTTAAQLRRRRWATALARSGAYGEPPCARVWGAQLAAWCACVIVGAFRLLAQASSLLALFRARFFSRSLTLLAFPRSAHRLRAARPAAAPAAARFAAWRRRAVCWRAAR